MRALARLALLLLIGFGLYVLQGSLLSVLPAGVAAAPQLAVVLAIYVGLERDVHVTLGCAMACGLGWIADSFTGLGLGLHAFVVVLGFLLAHGAGARILSRGVLFHVGISVGVALITGTLTLVLRAIFGRAALDVPAGFGAVLRLLAWSAIASGLVTPIVFAITRWAQSVAGVGVLRRRLPA